MYVHWRALCSLGLAFWGLLCATDLLGESTWKKCSPHVDDILKGQYNGLIKMQEERRMAESVENNTQKMNWPMLLWNICAFLCSLLFCTVIKSMSWFIWQLFRIYNIFRNRKAIANKLISAKLSEGTGEPLSVKEVDANKSNCKILFKNQMFATARDNAASVQEKNNLARELEELRREKSELSQQLMIAQKENISARQQIEEYKLETFMMKEKLARTANSLKENLKYKDYADANQELIARKAHSLEIHLKEVSRDRDLLRNKLTNMEKSYSKLEDRLRLYEKQDIENQEQFPEKDTSKPVENNQEGSESTDVCKVQKKIVSWEKGVEKTKKKSFEANSKISMDLDESSLDNSKENSDAFQETGDLKKADISAIKRNILNYNAYKAQMLRPRLKLANIKDRLYPATDTTGSSSDENGSTSCHRIISSTAEFQNFLKTLSSKSDGNVNFEKNFY